MSSQIATWLLDLDDLIRSKEHDYTRILKS